MEGCVFLSRMTAYEAVTEDGGFPGEPFKLRTLPPRLGCYRDGVYPLAFFFLRKEIQVPESGQS